MRKGVNSNGNASIPFPASADQASIIAGAAIAVVSVTWAAYSSANTANASLVVQSRRGECDCGQGGPVGGTGRGARSTQLLRFSSPFEAIKPDIFPTLTL